MTKVLWLCKMLYTSPRLPVQPMYALVRAYVAAEKTDQAIAFLQSVLKANPSNAEAYVLLGSVQLANKSPDQARQSFHDGHRKAAKEHHRLYERCANFYVLQKNYDEALKVDARWP